MKTKHLKKVLLGLIMGVLFFPLVFQPMEGTITKKLKGYQAPPKKVNFSMEAWFDGSWQNYIEAYSKDQLQARHFLIRLNNQLKYSLFDHLNANSVERGKNGFYFERRYITAYLGMNYQGEEVYQKKVEKFQELADTLNNYGVKTLYVIASGKANFMPENIPEKYQNIEKGPNNYEAFLKYMDQSSISYLDLNQYLLDMRDTATYPLYTKGNVHWSFYAMSYVTDTLMKTIEKQIDQDLPSYKRSPVELTNESTYYTEDGIFRSLNLYWTELQDTFAYRNIIPDEAESKDKYRPKVWAIGDSFYGTLNTYKIPHQFFDKNSVFFYYNHSITDMKGQNYVSGSIKSYPFIDKIKEQDLLLLFTTDAGIPGCCWGAEDELLEYFKKGK